MKRIFSILFCILSFSLFAENKVDKSKEAKAKEWLQNQPLEFIENKGQFTDTDGKPADNVLFKTSFGNCDIYITDKGLSYVFVKYEEDEGKGKKEKDFESKFGEREKEENKKVSYYRLDMDLVGANIDKANIIKEGESKQGHYNYFYAHCPQGIYDVKGYGKITIQNIYKGIDWVIYTNSDSKDHPLKYDFVVHPGADYKAIQIKFLNAQGTSLADNDTKLKIQTIAGNIEEGNLYSYTTPLCHAERSEASHTKTQTEIKNLGITSKYIITKDSIIQFEIANYDTTKTLIIDPLVWATYYGGSADDKWSSICVDSQDNIYVTGLTISVNFPTQQLNNGYWMPVYDGIADVFIVKFNNAGIRLWATYYGGSLDEGAFSIIADSQDDIYVSGYANSNDFPIQQLTGAYWQPNNAGPNDIFILKFNNQGTRLWATYYGGSNSESVISICSDSQDNIYLTGNTWSIDFPTQQLLNAYWQPNYAGGSAYTATGDVFVIKFNNNGVRLWATYYGGNNRDYGRDICVDSLDNIYIVGETSSTDFPVHQLTGAYWQANNAGMSDAFILKFNSQGVRQWATYYGGSNDDIGESLCKDHQNNLYVVGYTESFNFPTQQLTGAYWQANNAGMNDVFILKFNSQEIRQLSTYYGGSGYDGFHSAYGQATIINDLNDNVIVLGSTGSTDFPTQQLTGEYWQAMIAGTYDAYILKFNQQGIRQWATYYGSSGFDFASNIAIDNQNAVYFLGNIGGAGAYTLDYGNGAYYDNIWDGAYDVIILKCSSCNNIKPSSLQSDRNNICISDNGNITLTAIGGIGDTLKWYSDDTGQNYIGKNSPLTIPSPTQSTTYYARWESSCETSACDSIIINIFPIKDTIIYKIICQGESFQVGINNYTISGNYTDTLFSMNACDSIIKTYLTVNPSPELNIGNDTTICQGTSLVLNATIANAAYLWQDNAINSIYNVTQQGLYWVKITIDGCSNIDSINVIIEDCEIILEIPNFFSPNNDNINDEFKPSKTKGILSMNTSIYSRWGNLVFNSGDLNIKWDGKTNKGDIVADGVYYWIVSYTDRNYNKSSKNGSVTVMR